MHVLENEAIRLEIDERNGVLARIYSRRLDLELIKEPRLAGNFNILLPMPERETNYIGGKSLSLSAFEPGEKSARLQWNGPFTNAQGSFDVDVEMHIELADDAVMFSLHVENRSEYPVAEVWYPILGGLDGIEGRKDTRAMISSSHWSVCPDLFQNFPDNSTTNWGIPNRESNWGYPGVMPLPWIDFYNPESNHGVYFACHDPIARSSLLHLELWPGTAPDRPGGNWPESDDFDDDLPVGLIMQWVKFPYTPPGNTFHGPPVVVQFHEGDWHEASTIYRNWFDAHFPIEKNRNWLHKEIAWYYNVLMHAEDLINFTFEDIPRLAEEAREYNMRTILISGWQVGGHDRGYPEYRPDPRLGSMEGLKRAIEECHRLGVKVLLFANLQVLDRDTEWYRDELYKYRMMDSLGHTLGHPMGWGQGTLSARAGGPGGGTGWTQRMMAPASPGFAEFRKIITDQMVDLARIGADGLHLDKLCWNMGVPEFNPGHGRSPDLPNGEDLLAGVEEILRACQRVNPDFRITGEAWWDRMIQFLDGCWWATPGVDHISPFKYTFPEYLPLIGIEQPLSFSAINSMLLFGYGIFVGPGNYTQSIKDAAWQPLARYMREVIRLGEELKETIFLGRFLDTLQISVQAPETVKFRAHQNTETGKRAGVLVSGAGSVQQATVHFEGNRDGQCLVYKPFEEPESARLPVEVSIPPERVVVVLEQ